MKATILVCLFAMVQSTQVTEQNSEVLKDKISDKLEHMEQNLKKNDERQKKAMLAAPKTNVMSKHPDQMALMNKMSKMMKKFQDKFSKFEGKKQKFAKFAQMQSKA